LDFHIKLWVFLGTAVEKWFFQGNAVLENVGSRGKMGREWCRNKNN